jgi:serine/threonine protein kinase
MRLNKALRIAIALAAAHARGIIHRDLKFANVIVGTDQTVKVPRFRLGKLIGRGDVSRCGSAHRHDAHRAQHGGYDRRSCRVRVARAGGR